MKKKLSITIHTECYLLAIIPDIIGKHNSGKKLTSIDGLAAHLYYVAFHNRKLGIRTETPDPYKLLVYENNTELVLEVEERCIFNLAISDVPTLHTQLN